jgi:hypothetical protein
MAMLGKYIAVIGGLLILIQGLASVGGMATLALGYWLIASSTMSFLFAAVCGILVLVGSWISGKVGKEQTGAMLALVFSIISLGFGGGWIAGGILGLIGSLMLWKKK